MNPQITQRHRDAVNDIIHNAFSGDRMHGDKVAEILARRFPGWMPISEAPRDGTHILVGWFGVNAPNFGNEALPPWKPIAKMTVAHFHSGDWCPSVQTFDGPGLDPKPTHGMPLPPTPDAKG